MDNSAEGLVNDNKKPDERALSSAEAQWRIRAEPLSKVSAGARDESVV